MKGSSIFGLLIGIFFFIFGVAYLLWPERMIKYDLKQLERAPKNWPFRPPPNTRVHILGLRIIGAVVIIVFFLVLYAVLKYGN